MALLKVLVGLDERARARQKELEKLWMVIKKRYGKLATMTMQEMKGNPGMWCIDIIANQAVVELLDQPPARTGEETQQKLYEMTYAYLGLLAEYTNGAVLIYDPENPPWADACVDVDAN